MKAFLFFLFLKKKNNNFENMARLNSAPVNENNTSNGRNTQRTRLQYTHVETAYSRRQTTILSHFNIRGHTYIGSNPLLRSLYDHVNSIVQQPSGQDVTGIFFAVLSAINENISNPNSPLSMNPNANNLRQLYLFPQNGGSGLTLRLL